MPITTKNKAKIVVRQAGHPGTFRKMRCPKCKLGYAVQNNVNGDYACIRCGTVFKAGQL